MRTVKHPHQRDNLAYFLQGLIDGNYTLSQVAHITGYTKQHLCVLKKNYQKKGEKALVNGHKGLRSRLRIPAHIRKRIVDLYNRF